MTRGSPVKNVWNWFQEKQLKDPQFPTSFPGLFPTSKVAPVSLGRKKLDANPLKHWQWQWDFALNHKKNVLEKIEK